MAKTKHTKKNIVNCFPISNPMNQRVRCQWLRCDLKQIWGEKN